MEILAWIIVGLVAGVLASLLVGGTGYGILGDIIVGIGWAYTTDVLTGICARIPHVSLTSARRLRTSRPPAGTSMHTPPPAALMPQ